MGWIGIAVEWHVYRIDRNGPRMNTYLPVPS